MPTAGVHTSQLCLLQQRLVSEALPVGICIRSDEANGARGIPALEILVGRFRYLLEFKDYFSCLSPP